MKTLFIVAEMQEAQWLIEHYQLKRSKHYKMCKKGHCSINLWYNGDFELIITGAGINNVISSLSKAVLLGILTPYTKVINVGYAGAKGIEVGEVVCVKACHCFEFPTKANTEIENCIKLSNEGFDCYTSFDFVEDPLNIIDDKVLFDMELAYIARFVYDNLYSIKIVSDNLDYDGFKDFDGSEAWQKVINKIQEIK